MRERVVLEEGHPVGERFSDGGKPELEEGLVIETGGRRLRVQWDPQAPVTPLGQVAFFMQFLAVGGLFSDFLASCPIRYQSNAASRVHDVLGTMILGVLSGQQRFAHLNALREDEVNRVGLGLQKICSEDVVRRAFDERTMPCTAGQISEWLGSALARSWGPGLRCGGWILDIDVTIKPIYGRQEGARLGYNPHKPGRPSHAYHNYIMAGLRLVLDVEVRAGNEHAAKHGYEGLWRLWERFAPEERPLAIRGDAGYGNECLLAACEERGQGYLLRLRQTKKVKELVRLMQALEPAGAAERARAERWQKVGPEGWQACEGRLQLQGWSAQRRVVILRRRVRAKPAASAEAAEPAGGKASQQLLPWNEPMPVTDTWEYQVLVTNLNWGQAELFECYRQRGDCENTYDELKNQWGWSGFTTRDLSRSANMARMVALVYNWWTLFVRALEPTQAREAVSSRPLFLAAVGRLVTHAGGLVLRLTSTHAQAALAQKLQEDLSLFLSSLQMTAEQLNNQQRWERIWQRLTAPYRAFNRARLPPAPT